jgi:two-component system, OmpR family, phosphate regulon sensor histidine kinase PhoR
VKHRSATTIVLYRARLVFMLAALIPTVLMSAIGIILVATGGSRSLAIVAGILVLAFCAMAVAGYVLGSIFVARGSRLATIQNDFLASVSHELRTPLTSIRLFIDTLREDRVHDPVEKQRCLTVINQELRRLDNLVGRLIELSKIESRHAAFERKPVDVADIVADALAAFEAMKFGGGIEVHTKVEPGLVVRGDRSALAQAVGNLLSNAWKYTRPVDKKIDITADADLENVSITVSDNGVGIPRPEQEAIFEKFHRGAAAVETGSAGTGLGLAIVRAVVEAHRGTVDVRSHVDRGARFRITLPRYKVEAT